MPPYVDKRRKYINNLKLHGRFEDFKKKRAKLEKDRRLRLKESLAKMTAAKRDQLIAENSVKNRKGVQKFRLRKKELESRKDNEHVVSTSEEVPKNEPTEQPTIDNQQKEVQNQTLSTLYSNNCQKEPTSNLCTENRPTQSPIEHSASQPRTSTKFGQRALTSFNNNCQKESSSNLCTENRPAQSLIEHSTSQPRTSTKFGQRALTSFNNNCQKESSSNLCTENRPAQSPIEHSASQPTTSTEFGQRKEPLVTKSLSFEHSYKTPSALSKAVAKTKMSLPSSPSKRKAVIARLLRTFSEEDQRDIIGSSGSNGSKSNNGLTFDLVKTVRLFYERDNISRISPNVKDSRKFVDPDTGKKVTRQIRHLNYKLSEVYCMFLDDFKETNETDIPPVKLSKFCALRPEHVFLMSKTPQNACFCLYHSNFIQCAESLHKSIPDIPDYGSYELVEFLVCDAPTKECYFKTCKECSPTKTDKKIRAIAKSSPSNSKTVKWMKWEKDDAANRFQNHSEEGSVNQLVDYFLSIYPQFLKHYYVKKQQEKAFMAHRKRVDSDLNSEEAVLQIDFAENFKCECQDEVQQAHYNQKQISLFTTALHYAQSTYSKVIASDNTHHGKETLVAYLYAIFKDLPPTIKTVHVWSDGPSSQFKNKYIAAIIPLFQDKFGLTITWNFFATGHGKSCVDGIGAAVKSKVKGLILTRAEIVNNATDFVAAFNSKSKSKIVLIEMNDASIDKINGLLKLWFRFVDDVFAIVKRSQVDELMRVLNGTKYKSIKFTYETENDGKLPFLDLLLTRKADGSIEFGVYRKPTSTDRCITSESHCPSSHKMAALHSMKVKEIAVVNGYTVEKVESLVKKHSRMLKKDTLSTFFKANKKVKKLKPVKFGFMPPLTNSIKSIYKKSKIAEVIYTVNTKLKQILGTAKDTRPELEKSGIYKVTCMCGEIYLGQSKRQVMVRYKEHISAIKNNHPEKSAVALHAIQSLHLNVDGYKLELVKQVGDVSKLDAWESLYMHKHQPSHRMMNIEPPPIQSPLFNLI